MRKLRQAFTLLELIVVIVILGLLAAMVVPTFKNIIDKSKLEIVETTAAAFARETVALASFDTATTGGKILETHALMTAADMPQLNNAATQAAVFENTGTQVVFSNWEFSGNTNVVSVKLADDGARMGVAISVPTVGCAFALAEGTNVTSWNVKGIDAANCNGSLALVDEIPELSAPPVPGGLKIGWGVCPDGQPGWLLEWTEVGVKVDLYVNGVFIGVGEFPSACITGTSKDDIVTGVPRDPKTEDEEEIDDETKPGGWPGGAGNVGEVLDDEVIEIPEPEVENPHNPKDPSQSEKEEIKIEEPTTVVIDWDRTQVPGDADEIIIIKKPVDGTLPTNRPVPADQEEAINEELPPGDYEYVARPVKDGKPVGPDLPVTVKPVERPVAVPNPSGGGNSLVQVIGDTVNLAWGTVPNTPQAPVTGYKVYRATSAQGPWTEITVTDNVTSRYSDTKLSPGKYYYTVASFGPGGESPRSTPAEAIVIGPPAAPVNLVGSPANGKALLSWNAVEGVNGYRVYDAANPATPVGTFTTPTATISGLTNGQAYTFYVVAYNSVYPSSHSSSVTVTPNATPVTNPDSFKVPAGVTQIEVNIGGSNGVTPVSLATGGRPGNGASFRVTLNVTPGETLTFKRNVGGGAPGVGTTPKIGTAGGGASQVLRGEELILVAGGGGGVGASSSGQGGDAGLPGASGTAGKSTNTNSVGKGGTQTAGGAGGYAEANGSFGQGGKGVDGVNGAGAGGGGGYYGGGGGRAAAFNGDAFPGGGGSSYIAPNTTAGSFTPLEGANAIPNQIIIKY